MEEAQKAEEAAVTAMVKVQKADLVAVNEEKNAVTGEQ